MRRLHITLFTLFLILFNFTSSSQDANKQLPVDPSVTIGKLDNGITYYIRVNKKPEQRAELRLAVNAGSVLEDDDQRGLAHLCEHMAFNGTTNFRKKELVDYLESIGMRFGPELNAYTSFDETVYMLTIPTDKDTILQKAFQVLEDWAHNVTYDSVEIEKERGVVIEEWRLGRGAEMRMMDKQFPVLLRGSRYADRIVIGTKEILESSPQNRLKQYYKDWYRPDLMAVIAVGDFNAAEIEKLIKDHFSNIPITKDARNRLEFDVPDQKEPSFAIATDPEATMSRVGIYYKHPAFKEKTTGDYRKKIVEALYDGIFNNRLRELTFQADPPFLGAGSSTGSWARTKDIYMLSSTVKDNGIERGLEALLMEAARVRKFGFTQSELERQKSTLMRGMEQEYNERDKTESRAIVNQFVYHFLDNEPAPGIEDEYEMYRQYLPGIKLDELNKLTDERITDDNQVIMVNGPDKQGVKIPTASELKNVINSIGSKDLTAYEDKIASQPLISNPPKPGSIVEEKVLKTIGVTEWKLSNGVRVILKPTDFKNDEVLFTAFSPGGTSVIGDTDFIPASTSGQIIIEGGVGAFNQIELQKILQGKIVRVSPYIGELDEGFSGSASPKDIETMFQLIYMYGTSPRMDSTGFLAFKERVKAFLQNRGARPESVFQDTVQTTLAQYHPRRLPWNMSVLDKFDLKKSFAIYQDRFRDASDFTFIIDGAFHVAEMKPLILKYIGGLPATNRIENWKDIGVDYPKGIVTKKVKKGIEPKSAVQLVFTGPFEWTRENRHALQSLVSVLDIKLREALREEKGGTYGIGIGATPTIFPKQEYRLAIGWGCSPDRIDELLKAAIDQIDSIKKFGATDIYITKVKESQLRTREVNLKENRFWLNALQSAYYYNDDPLNILKYDELVNKVNSDFVRSAAQKYLDLNNYVQVVLYPENK